MKALLALGALIVLAGIYVLTIKHSPSAPTTDFPYVKNLDIDKFMGKWYVISAKPNIIEKNCKCARTVDTRIDDTTIELAETCLMLGKWITDKSKAVIEEPRTGRWTNVAHLMKADYWVIDVDEKGYSWAVIGQPSLKGYWILSRAKTLD